MKIIGLFVVVFAGVLFSKAVLEPSETVLMVGTVIGAGSYIILMLGDNDQ